MINHVVMFKLKDEIDGYRKKEYALEIKKRLERLKDAISQIVDISVEINNFEFEGNFDLVLMSKFETLGDLQVYQDHPSHQEVVKFIKTHASGRSCLDYNSEQ